MSVKPPPIALVRGLAALAVLILGVLVAVMFVVTSQKPPQVEPEEPVLVVNMQTAATESTTVELLATGVAAPVRMVKISAEVAGPVVEMNRILKMGDLVQKDELLAKIDPRDYELRVKEAKASVMALEAASQMIDTGESSDREQLKLSRRSLQLAQDEFDRVKGLRDEGLSVSQSAVDAAEQAVQQQQSQVVQLQQSLNMVPSRRSETDSQLNAAQARLAQAERNLERCFIRAPFQGRVQMADLELGEYVQPGVPLFQIADDQSIEIPITVSATDLRRWIPFTENTDGRSGWFPPLAPRDVTVQWSEADRDHQWTGRLDRVMDFDASTRTATLAVRVEGEAIRGHGSGFPLTDGMFCTVRIPGKTLGEVFILPRSAVTFDNKVYRSVDGRLETASVEVLDRREGRVIVGSGLQEGDLIVTTRLVAPLEGALLQQAEN